MNKNFLKLKIELKDLPHKVIRKVLVPEDISMFQLHLVIQESIGWFNAHLFEFCDAKSKSEIRVGIPDEFDEDFACFASAPKRDAFQVLLKDSFLMENGAKPFWYWYDFGDDWWHQITFLKNSKKDEKQFHGAPICIDAIGKCPPEDVGGPWGYTDFLKSIRNKKHPEHEEIREWYGLEPNEKYNEMEVDLNVINTMLNDLYKSEEWNSNDFEVF
ncbi:plasmid pRiA4b ORF-3 family protein [Aequorivita capsosiphonis]|uniref:plasmid pRiA4b ORF-3 family protein n=1 Tax=Aequorivita capsosiphonis TaxID=487317 RepID=UPI0003FB440B|nr:plasmid pRiA4b ORF-3 family protein [Aequorivita capsosiphonis]